MIPENIRQHNKIIALVGPTATGKTDLALLLAKACNGELVSCDSRQVYRGLDVVTGKFPGESVSVEKRSGYWIVDGVYVWMYDVVDIEKQYTLKDYIIDATRSIHSIIERGKLPIIVGGTGLYLQGLLEGIDLVAIDISKREEMERLSLDSIQRIVQLKDERVWNELNNSERNNKRRLIRHIERIESGTSPDRSFGLLSIFDILKIGLNAPKEMLERRIDERVERWIQNGFIEEGKRLLQDGVEFTKLDQLGLDYRYLGQFLSGKITYEELIYQLKIKNHQYAKRQMTWFKRDKEINWFSIYERGWEAGVVKLISDWYNGSL